VTPRRTIAVAVLTFVAVVASPFVADVITRLLAEGCSCPRAGHYLAFGHALWHLLWAALTLAIALGIRRFRRAWPATGVTERDATLGLQSSPRESTAPAPNRQKMRTGKRLNQYQLLAFAQLLAITTAAGNILASAGAADFNELYFAIVHTPGEVLAVGSLWTMLFVCLHMLGIGVRGAIRRQLIRAEAR
jgi:hypothetical protein